MSADDPDHASLAGPFPGLGYLQPVSDRDFTSLLDSDARPMRAPVAEEVPVAFVYAGRPHAVMMASPCDLEDLAVGFTLSEGIVERADEISGVTVSPHTRGVDLMIDVAPVVADRLAARARAVAGRTGCGLCGVEAIDDAVRTPRRVTSPLTVEVDAIWRAAAGLEAQQPLNRDTHAIHGAAWATASGEVRVVREDVGRHNALDKVLGALARAGITAADGFVVVTSRASFELVQKVAVFGVPILAAVSRPTGLAIRMAEAANMGLLGLVRGESANVYANPSRVRGLESVGQVQRAGSAGR